LKGARRFLTVSSATANDLNQLLPSSVGTTEWCHLAPASVFAETSSAEGTETLWLRLQKRIGLRGPFVLLPATSAVGSYKNPEFVADALSHPSLASVVLLLCGLAADQRCRELESLFPSLRGRVFSSGLSDPELAVVYARALAVVIPSRIEGFGLPAIEAMAAGGIPLLADSRGLREAGGEAALRFSLRDPRELSAMLQMLLDPSSSEWLKLRLKPRVEQRLSRLNPDLFGLALLAQARQASC
jgi:glycosyltransferase involved in cell wall biosynthesis